MSREIVVLNDGSQVSRKELVVAMRVLRNFSDGGIVGAINLWELAQGANDKAHKYDSDALGGLQAWGLVRSDGTMHENIQAIARNAIVLEGDFDVSLVDPVKS